MPVLAALKIAAAPGSRMGGQDKWLAQNGGRPAPEETPQGGKDRVPAESQCEASEAPAMFSSDDQIGCGVTCNSTPACFCR